MMWILVEQATAATWWIVAPDEAEAKKIVNMMARDGFIPRWKEGLTFRETDGLESKRR